MEAHAAEKPLPCPVELLWHRLWQKGPYWSPSKRFKVRPAVARDIAGTRTVGDSNVYPFLLHKLSSFCPSALQGSCQSETRWQLRSQFNCCHRLVPRQMNSFMIHIHCEHIKYPGVLTADKTIAGSRAGRRVLLFPNDNFLRLITDFPLSIEMVGVAT